MLIKSFTIYNFLNYDYYTINFNKFSTIKDLNILKSLYVFKYLVTLSEEHPELAALITNEIKPHNEETIFKIEVEIKGEVYSYQINVFDNEITFEEFIKDRKLIYQRINNEIILEEEPIVWNCENGKYKPFLNTCATSSNQAASDFFYFIKESMEGIAPWISSPLNDLIKKLFVNEDDELIELVRNINICFDDNIINIRYPMDINLLNDLTGYSFKTITDLRTRKFLKLNIFLNWLKIIQGGVLVIDDTDLLEFKTYIEKYLNNVTDIQVLMIE